MIECIFTLDYELYGNGEGSLEEQIVEPAEGLKELFLLHNARFVNFVEVAELAMIEEQETDSAIATVRKQLRDFYQEGFEIGLHIHPQWYNARIENGSRQLDQRDYNLCTLPKEYMAQILDRAIDYLGNVIDQPGFIPFSFRNSNWLFQPSQPLADILAERGIRLDSSVIKGGYQHKHHLDYRRALQNGLYWNFANDVTLSDPSGALLEIPTYSIMVFPWKVLSAKRIQLQQKASASYPWSVKVDRLRDFLRFKQPLKLDFCRLTIKEITDLFDRVTKEDRKDPAQFRPIVTIGHTKDLGDFETVELFLRYLSDNNIPISTFRQVCERHQLIGTR